MSKIKSLGTYIVPAIIGAVMLFSGVNMLLSMRAYRIANAEYEGLKSYVEEVPVVTTTDEVTEETVEFPMLEVDFEGLREINPDCMGWLVIPALDLSYPYVKGKDNEEYLHKTYEGTSSNSGSVFMDSYNYPNFRDFNTLLYAHNMRDKSMFGSLKLMAQDESLITREPYIYAYTPKASFKFQIFAYYVTNKKSDTYQIMLKPEEYDAYIEYIKGVNQMQNIPDIDMSERPRILTLSTCQGAAGTSQRFVVHAALVDRIDNE